MRRVHQISRRMFLRDVGGGAIAIAVLAACTTEDDPVLGGQPPSTTAPTAAGDTATDEFTWRRVALGNVSAYVVARGDEAAVVDTGNPGSADRILEALTATGLGWSAVGHVVLTHRHPDHIGSLSEVLAAASGATAYVGHGDIDNIESPRPLQAVGDGDEVFGMQVIETPGHTEGHVSVYDPTARFLLAGDALNGDSGMIAGPNPDFSADMETAIESARKLAALEVDTAVFGHGDPVERDANRALADLAARL